MELKRWNKKIKNINNEIKYHRILQKKDDRKKSEIIDFFFLLFIHQSPLPRIRK